MEMCLVVGFSVVFLKVKILTEAISPGSFSWSRDIHNASLLCKLSDV